MTEETLTSEQLRAEARQVAQDLDQKQRRASVIDGEIEAVKSAIAEARIGAARNDQDVAAAAPEERATLAALREERDTLPEEIHALRERRLSLEVEAEQVFRAELAPLIEQAKVERDAKAEAAREAQGEADAAQAALNSLGQRKHRAGEALRENSKRLRGIRDEGVRDLTA